jgi:predicted O-methyltransferase YrrM
MHVSMRRAQRPRRRDPEAMPPTQSAIDGLQHLYPVPAWVTGATPLRDAEFLLEMVTAQAPVRVVEVGVAAGVSSAVLLYSLDTLPGEGWQRELISCDSQAGCYFDASRPTGGAVGEIYPRFRSHWRLETGIGARELARTIQPGSVDLTFIDANHSHPWPLLDLLHLTACAKPGSWVVLHDINLPVLKPQFQVWGAKWLFDAWPFEKVAGGAPRFNIGAVRLPDDFATLVPVATALFRRSWDSAPEPQHLELPPWLAGVATLLGKGLRPCA